MMPRLAVIVSKRPHDGGINVFACIIIRYTYFRNYFIFLTKVHYNKNSNVFIILFWMDLHLVIFYSVRVLHRLY